MATIYNIMLYGGLALAVIFAVTAIVLFFTLKIPKAIGDVTGSTARKKIEEIREKGYESVQGVGISKKEAIKNHTTKISVRDVQSSESSKRAEKGRANYEKAVADIKNKKKNEDYLKSIHEEATDILHEDMQELARNMYSDEEATDVLMENEDSEDDIILLDGNELDLDEVVTTAFVLAMDTKNLCSEDCKGLCAKCGADLNLGPCGCRPDVDPRWAALAQLLDDEN